MAPPAPAIAPQTASARLRSGPLGEGREDERQRRRRHHRAAQALQSPGDQQHALGLRHATDERGAREQRDPGHEQPTPSELVGQAPAEQQKPAEHQRIGVQDPREALLREADVALDRRQRDVDHGRVQNDHELRNRDNRQHRARVDTQGRADKLRSRGSGHAG